MAVCHFRRVRCLKTWPAVLPNAQILLPLTTARTKRVEHEEVEAHLLSRGRAPKSELKGHISKSKTEA